MTSVDSLLSSHMQHKVGQGFSFYIMSKLFDHMFSWCLSLSFSPETHSLYTEGKIQSFNYLAGM